MSAKKSDSSARARTHRYLMECGYDVEVTSREVSKALGIPLRSVSESLSKMALAGIVKNRQVKGQLGNSFSLKRPPPRIKFWSRVPETHRLYRPEIQE